MRNWSITATGRDGGHPDMPHRDTLFPLLPDGFVYRPQFISAAEEAELLAHIGTIEFGEVRMRGVVARRRVRQFGWHYQFETFRLTESAPVPDFLRPLQARAAALAGVGADALAEALVTEYSPGATIGWHRDAPVFGIVVGISLASACTFKLRPNAPGTTPAAGRGAETRGWEKPLSLTLEPRSAYVLNGEARRAWQHSIPATTSLRYSVTFRTLRRKAPPAAPLT